MTRYLLGMLDDTDGSRFGPHYRERKMGGVGDGDLRPPKGFRVVRVATASSPELEDLASCRRDLEMARMFASTYREAPRPEQADPRRPESAFWIAALTMYGRAFATGVRTAKVSLEDLEDADLEAHKYYIDLRNKYVAHAVNGYEGSTVLAYITDSSFSRPQITRVGQVHTDIIPLDDDELEDFMLMCTRFVEQLQKRIEKLHRKIQRELWAMGQESVYALPDLNLDLERQLARESVARPRKRHRASNAHRSEGSKGGDAE